MPKTQDVAKGLSNTTQYQKAKHNSQLNDA